MADSDSQPGPNVGESRSAVKDVLLNADARAMTAGMVADEIDYSRRTVHSRLKELEGDGEIASGKIGQATAYWIPEDPEPAPGPAREPKVNDGGELMPIEDWFKLHVRKFYPYRILPLTAISALLGWYFVDATGAVVAASLMFVAFPAVFLYLTLIWISYVKPKLESADESAGEVMT